MSNKIKDINDYRDMLEKGLKALEPITLEQIERETRGCTEKELLERIVHHQEKIIDYLRRVEELTIRITETL